SLVYSRACSRAPDGNNVASDSSPSSAPPPRERTRRQHGVVACFVSFLPGEIRRRSAGGGFRERTCSPRNIPNRSWSAVCVGRDCATAAQQNVSKGRAA